MNKACETAKLAGDGFFTQKCSDLLENKFETNKSQLTHSCTAALEMSALLLDILPGDELIMPSYTFVSTANAFALRGGVPVFVDIRADTLNIDENQIELAITPKTKAIYAETMGNPQINVLDISAIAEIAHEAGIPLVIDNTFASPYLCQPIKHGADIVVQSATKFIGGHGTTMGGVIVESGKFPWDNGNFPSMTEPSEGYHGVRFYETFGDFGFTMKARMETLRTLGPSLAPMSAWLLLQGLETLHVRMDRHVSNALKVATFLESHDRVSWVNFPGLVSSPDYALAEKYMPKGCGSIMTFGIKGGVKAGEQFIEALEFHSHLANVGDAKSLVIHPASTTHRQLSEEDQLKAGITPDMIRLSVGIEDIDDILWDLEQALVKSSSLI